MLSYDPKLMAKTVPADFRHDRRLATAAAAATTPLAEAKSESLDDVFEDEPEFDKGYQFESRCAAATCRQAELVGHQGDVRTACSGAEFVATGSRDRTARLWTEETPGSRSYTETRSLAGHTHYVTAICYVYPTEKHPRGLIATGCQDKLIRLFDPTSSGKEEIRESPVGLLGQNARVWLDGKSVLTLAGHTHAVWAVAVVPKDGLKLTGSADKTIRLWKVEHCERIFTGHDDCVRGLAVVSATEFLSCSTDSSIRRWLTSGECIQVYYGHTAFVYSVVAVPDGASTVADFVSSSEDRTLRVWKGNECVQTLTHPAQSVWCCGVLSNGDIITGSSDGVARIFTTDSTRTADREERDAFQHQVASQSLPSSQVGDLKVSDKAGIEALQAPGIKDGQTKVVKVKPHAYQWSASAHDWIKVGKVVDAVGSDRKQMLDGKAYDYVFNVELDLDTGPQTGRSYRLGYNITEDPWFAAQQFLQKNELSPMHLDQVAQFIIENTKGVTVASASEGPSDPFTGGARYVPAGPSFTGGGAGAPRPLPSGPSDPFTGGARYIPANVSASSEQQVHCRRFSSNPYFPKTTPITFGTINPAAVFRKLVEFNETLTGRLSETELQTVDAILEASSDLEKLTPLVNDQSTSVLWKILCWPDDIVFPGLDVLRMVVRCLPGNQLMCARGAEFLERLIQLLTVDNSAANMLSLRVLANLFAHSVGTTLLCCNVDQILVHLEYVVENSNKGAQVALSTVLLNYAVAFCDGDKQVDIKGTLLSTLTKMLRNQIDKEAAFRVLVAIGTLLSSHRENAGALALSLETQKAVSLWSGIVEPKKVGECAKVVENILA
ncbi:phospholipase A-2-activating protein-like [Oscarella lobularis]|uniref:phospholipase A-2-activating protein-like n=1 Tax=Oscarella lobularis TaxID=121494 RepID=UPI0033136FDE